MKWLWRLSLKKRILIAVMLLPAIHAAFYTVPRWAATRPRFDEKAWQQATDLLKEEVGAAAVENGAFFIPKEPILTVYRGRAMISSGLPHHPDMYLSKENGDSYLLIRLQESGGLLRYARLKTADITDGKAREIWNVLAYLHTVEGAGANLYVPWPKRIVQPATTLVDDTWPPATSEYPHSRHVRDSLSPAIARECALRLALSLSDSDELGWSSGDAAVVNALVRLLSTSISFDCSADRGWAEFCVDRLALMPNLGALPPLRRMSKLQAAQDNSLPDKLVKLPIIGRLFERRRKRKYGFREIEAQVWLVGNLTGQPPDRQMEIVSSAVLDPSMQDAFRRTAFLFFQHRWPQECAEFTRKNFTRFSHSMRVKCMLNYEEFLGKDTRVARLAVRDTSADIQLLAYHHLYHLTEDETLLAKMMEFATPGDGADTDLLLDAAYYLADIWREGSCPVDIPQFLRGHFCEDNAYVVLALLAEAGGRENLDFLLSFVLSDEEVGTSSLEHGSPLSYMRLAIAGEAAGSGDPHVLDAFIDYLKSGGTKGNEKLYDAVIDGLAGTGSRKVLQALEGLLATEEKKVEDPAQVSTGHLVVRLRHAVAELRCRPAENPLDFEFPAALSANGAQRLSEAHSEALAAKYTLEELQTFLADKEYAARRGEIYAAIVRKRRGDQ